VDFKNTVVIMTSNVGSHLILSYSHFSAGEFIHKTGRDKDSSFLYAALQDSF
jgi:ATP-dependent Clp protease ATP-binding subunit ClpA